MREYFIEFRSLNTPKKMTLHTPRTPGTNETTASGSWYNDAANVTQGIMQVGSKIKYLGYEPFNDSYTDTQYVFKKNSKDIVYKNILSYQEEYTLSNIYSFVVDRIDGSKVLVFKVLNDSVNDDDDNLDILSTKPLNSHWFIYFLVKTDVVINELDEHFFTLIETDYFTRIKRSTIEKCHEKYIGVEFPLSSRIQVKNI